MSSATFPPATPDAPVTATPAPVITIAIATLDDRAARIRLPPPQAGLRYLVMVQPAASASQPPVAPPFAARPDVTVIHLPDRGLSRSRNAALAHLQDTTPDRPQHADDSLILFSDDDITLDPAGILLLGAALRADPALDFAAGHRAERATRPRLQHPHRLTRFNSGRICAPELMLRAARFAAAGVRFDIGFGLGARHPIGEEYVFVTDALKAGLRGHAFAITTGSHPQDSSGDDWSDPVLLHSRAIVLGRVFGWLGGPIRLIYALRHRRRFDSMAQMLRFLVAR